MITSVIALPPAGPRTRSMASAATRVEVATAAKRHYVKICGVQERVAGRNDQDAKDQGARNGALWISRFPGGI